MFEEVLTFWFKDTDTKKWWMVDTKFDELLRNRFLDVLQQATAGELYTWRNSARGRLAEIIVLDQFSRNIYRNSPLAFAQDPMALALSQEAVATGSLNELSALESAFLLMPYMHSESRIIHAQAEILFRKFTLNDNFEFELKHKAIIDRFGRYPHRNLILGRASTSEEIEFLKQPGTHF